jgi:hypothetical protein
LSDHAALIADFHATESTNGHRTPETDVRSERSPRSR